MAALTSPPVAMRACRLASRLMKPMEWSWSSCCWNLTSGVCTWRDRPCEVGAGTPPGAQSNLRCAAEGRGAVGLLAHPQGQPVGRAG